ncbi:MAG: hypothetical protein IRZ31_01365 [Thermogemmatispora sp.]|uniref:hypothetical protein n=1 Tax=Thermogemmatispora sp. TaxID=1968838 RepID=UPI002637226F|nr:hypothetical protein [Thermogemmatispora sp.]MBX5455521.1 hypothetical protein [Thermogemmatispora sp.]
MAKVAGGRPSGARPLEHLLLIDHCCHALMQVFSKERNAFMLRRTMLVASPFLASALTAPGTSEDPTLILASSDVESSARLLIRAATLAQRAGRLNEALRLAHAARELARGFPYEEIACAYLAVLWGERALLRQDRGALEEAQELARHLRGRLLRDGDLQQLRLQLALFTTPSASSRLSQLTLEVWQRPELILLDGSWHWARGGFIVKSLEALILTTYLAQARELFRAFEREVASFQLYEALRWEWNAIRLRLLAPPEERRTFRRLACARGYLRQAIIAL